MHVVVIDQRSGEVLKSVKFPDDKPMVCREVADEYCSVDLCDEISIAEPDGYIPSSCGDIRIEFREDPKNDVVIWSGESFYFDGGE